MKLFSSRRSPHVRKVLIAAHELGLAEDIELVPQAVAGLTPDEELWKHNSLGQIPTLVTDDGRALFDSGVIVEYLQSLRPGLRLIALGPSQRIDALHRQAWADGLIEILLRWEGERRRELDPRQPDYIAAHRARFLHTFDAWETVAQAWDPARFDIGDIAIACALSYADLRFASQAWRDGRPALASWFDRVSQRASFTQTAFDPA
ncbi:glutathione S-transferase family protein [Chelatococcus sp. GCM10030263]|uniref:glutathione S-transferase family protein n=1 Tax=Chelatococcus sp. GCM10030263 TaxID=3273387 RepID=UPI003620BAF5